MERDKIGRKVKRGRGGKRKEGTEEERKKAMDKHTVPHLRDWVVVDIDDSVEVANDHPGHLFQFLEVKLLVWHHISIECDRGEVTHCHLARGIQTE